MNNKDNYDLSNEDEFLIKLSLLLHKLPNEIEEEMPIMYYDMYRKYLNKYGDPNSQIIQQIAQLTHALVCCHGNKTLQLKDFLPYEYKKIQEDAYWDNMWKTRKLTKADFELANNILEIAKSGMTFKRGFDKAVEAVEKVYGKDHNLFNILKKHEINENKLKNKVKKVNKNKNNKNKI